MIVEGVARPVGGAKRLASQNTSTTRVNPFPDPPKEGRPSGYQSTSTNLYIIHLHRGFRFTTLAQRKRYKGL